MTGAPDRARDAYRRVAETKDTGLARDVALLLVRLALAWDFIFHGARTLFGAFGGPGVHQGSIFYGTVAHLHPATFFTVLGGSIELFGGIAVGLGILGRLAAVGLAGDMAMAMATVTFGNGIINTTAPGGGYEINVVLAALALAVAILGTGRFSLDVVLRGVFEGASVSKVKPGGEVSYEDRPGQVSAT